MRKTIIIKLIIICILKFKQIRSDVGLGVVASQRTRPRANVLLTRFGGGGHRLDAGFQEALN
jgi:nanoRNase/pAp phosphatase (c-di-AMP/oligoRNAs hydrolase)